MLKVNIYDRVLPTVKGLQPGTLFCLAREVPSPGNLRLRLLDDDYVRLSNMRGLSFGDADGDGMLSGERVQVVGDLDLLP